MLMSSFSSDWIVCGLLPAIDCKRLAANLGGMCRQEGSSWTFRAQGSDLYRLILSCSGTGASCSVMLLQSKEPGVPWSLENPLCLVCSDFLARLYSAGEELRHPATPYIQCLTLYPRWLCLNTAECVERLSGEPQEPPRERPFDKHWRFEMPFPGAPDTRAEGTIECRSDFGWIKVEFQSFSSKALLDAITVFVGKLVPRYDETVMEVPWDLDWLHALECALGTRFSREQEFKTTPEGIVIARESPPRWLKLPTVPQLETGSEIDMHAYWIRQRNERPLRLVHAERSNNGRPAMIAMWGK